MHGIVFVALKDYVTDNYGQDAWTAMLEEVDPDTVLYIPLKEYPDEDLFGFVEAAVEMTGVDEDTLVRDFGSHIVPPLMQTYGAYAEDDWSALELIANTEEYIHESLRERHDSTFTPPQLTSEWIDEDTVSVGYESGRQLCELAKGIIDGIADHYDEDLTVTELQCMKDGHDHCEMQVHRASADAEPVERERFEELETASDGDGGEDRERPRIAPPPTTD